jgi:hypothetical protein
MTLPVADRLKADATEVNREIDGEGGRADDERAMAKVDAWVTSPARRRKWSKTRSARRLWRDLEKCRVGDRQAAGSARVHRAPEFRL